MYDLKTINSVLNQLEEERGIKRESVFEAIELALATAYKKEYGKKSHIIRATFDRNTGNAEFFQVKIVVDPAKVVESREDLPGTSEDEDENPEDEVVVFNEEHHILLNNAKLMKTDAVPGDELTFPLEVQQDFGRIASQTAKQVIMQKIREAEKVSVLGEFSQHEGETVSGTVQRIERGNIFIDLGRATGLLAREEQIVGERFRQGERIRALLLKVEEGHRGVFLKLSRSHPNFLKQLFESETPELTTGAVEIKAIAREAGSRTKIAVVATEAGIDPVGAMVGQRGVRVSTVMSELGGEKIDIIEWSDDQAQFIEDALSPAKVLGVKINEENHTARVEVAEDQQSLAIGKGGQNVRLAAKLTGWRIDVQSSEGTALAEGNTEDETLMEETNEITPAEDLGETLKAMTENTGQETDTQENEAMGEEEESTETPKDAEVSEATTEEEDQENLEK